ncbi:hypothetical protein GQ457_11G032100 [Hibiscus cannabinus]
MISTSERNLYESQSITKPPYFNGDNYPYWKNHMRLFIKSNDYQMTDEDRRILQNHGKAMHMLFCVLGPDEFAKMSSCTSAKEIWDKLETTYESTNDVKETKIGLLNLSYENLKMETNEDITKMFDQFSVIVNGLKGFREVTAEEKLVRKLIYSLPES